MASEADEVLLGKRPRIQATAIKNPRKMYGFFFFKSQSENVES